MVFKTTHKSLEGENERYEPIDDETHALMAAMNRKLHGPDPEKE